MVLALLIWIKVRRGDPGLNCQLPRIFLLSFAGVVLIFFSRLSFPFFLSLRAGPKQPTNRLILFYTTSFILIILKCMSELGRIMYPMIPKACIFKCTAFFIM